VLNEEAHPVISWFTIISFPFPCSSYKYGWKRESVIIAVHGWVWTFFSKSFSPGIHTNSLFSPLLYMVYTRSIPLNPDENYIYGNVCIFSCTCATFSLPLKVILLVLQKSHFTATKIVITTISRRIGGWGDVVVCFIFIIGKGFICLFKFVKLLTLRTTTKYQLCAEEHPLTDNDFTWHNIGILK